MRPCQTRPSEEANLKELHPFGLVLKMKIINPILSHCLDPPNGVETIYANECTSKI